jgi:hypothetical protein
LSLYSEPSTSKVARLVAQVLAARPRLVSFFGADRITVLSRAEASLPIRRPLLGVVPQSVKPVRVGGDLEFNLPVTVRIYLPVETPIARRTAPAAPAAATGPVTTTSVDAWYRISDVDQYGESAASAAVHVTTSLRAAALTMPVTTRDGFRVWRATAEDGQYHFAGLSLGSAGTWIDTVAEADLRDELAPILDYQEALVWEAIEALYTGEAEMLEDDGRYHADAALEVTPRGPALITRRNLLLYEFDAVFPILIEAATGTNVTAGAP